jgi:hypothetical protein
VKKVMTEAGQNETNFVLKHSFNRKSDLISAFEFEDAGLTEESPDPNIVLQCKAAFIIQPTLSQMWPEQTRLGRHLRSRFRCSMCSAVRMD